MKAELPQPLEQIERWRSDLDTLIQHMITLSKVRYLYRAVQEMTSQNPNMGGVPACFAVGGCPIPTLRLF